MNKKEAGITLVVLAVTVIVLLIIASVSVASGMSAAKTAKDNKLKSELQMIQHAVLEQYHKYRVTQDVNVLIGESKDKEQASELLKDVPNVSLLANDGYYLLVEEKEGNRKDLSAIGFDLTKEGAKYKEDAKYLVNYQTGLVYNVTKKATSTGEPLFLPETTKAEYIVKK